MSRTIHVYPQNESLWTDPATWGTAVAGVLLFAFFVQRSLEWLNLPFESIFEASWNFLVKMTPTSLVMLHPSAKAQSEALLQTQSSPVARSQAHAAKSNVLRSVLRLDGKPGDGESMPPARLLTPKGLGNWDNSCYQNSILQSLSSVASFYDFLNPIGNHLNSDTTTEALFDLIQTLNNGDSKDRYIWTPPKLKSMSSWQQQDAQEYFSKIMDAIEKDYMHLEASRRASEGIRSFSLLGEGLAEMDKARSTMSAPQALQSPLDGLLAQRVGCTRCGYCEGLSMIPFNCLTLPLEQRPASNLSTSFDQFCQLESIEGVECVNCTLLAERNSLKTYLDKMAQSDGQGDARDPSVVTAFRDKLAWTETLLKEENFDEDPKIIKKCSKASQTTTNKTRQAVIMRAPQTLVLHLNRSIFDEVTFQQLKNFTDVEYPLILDIGKWCLGDPSSSPNPHASQDEHWPQKPGQSMVQTWGPRPSNVQYGLRSIVSHYGRHENGHYVAYRKLDRRVLSALGKIPDDVDLDAVDRKWWRISDESVILVEEDEALSQGGAFMLFYERLSAEELRSSRSLPLQSYPAVDSTLSQATTPSQSASSGSLVGEVAQVNDFGDMNTGKDMH